SNYDGAWQELKQESAARCWRGGRYIFSTGRMVLWNTEPTDQASSSSHEATPVASRRDSRKKYCRSSFGKPERRKRERFFRRRNSGRTATESGQDQGPESHQQHF